MLSHPLRRWANIEPTLGERLVFAELLSPELAVSSTLRYSGF